jgi:hypothetical protein
MIGESRTLVNQRFSTTTKQKCMAVNKQVEAQFVTWVCEQKTAASAPRGVKVRTYGSERKALGTRNATKCKPLMDKALRASSKMP